MEPSPPDFPPPPPPALEIGLFGPFRLRVAGREVPRLRSHAGQALLGFLALRTGRETERARLAELLWPDSCPEQALYNLRRNLTDLRSALGPESRRLLSPSPRALAFDLAGADCDLVEFDGALRKGDEASLRAAVELYQGPLMEGLTEAWVRPERAAREAAYLSALERLAGSGPPREALSYVRRLLAHDPFRESAHLRLWEALAECGDAAALTRAYRDLCILLRREMGAAPAPETERRYRELLGGLRTPSVPPRDESAPVPPATTGSLPAYLTPRVGRGEAVEKVEAALESARLVTLTGPGGVGKTRLAVAVAERLWPAFADGVWFADLAPLTRPKQIAGAVAELLGIGKEAGRPRHETLRHALAGRRLLLILDNCEHLAESCAALSRELLAGNGGFRILATSREPLDVEGERLCRVPPLSVPPEEAASPGELLRHESVRLFVERATWSDSGFRLTGENAGQIAEICRKLDGLPLALELAAARMRGMSPRELSHRLSEGMNLPARRESAGGSRHRTLRATMDWSYALLTEPERVLLGRLSVFAGGWTPEAAVTVGAGDRVPAGEVPDLLSRLADRSLAHYDPPTGRYHFLETIRRYALERLRESEGEGPARLRHLSWCIRFVGEAMNLHASADSRQWLRALDGERDNLRVAVEWAAGEGPEALRGSGSEAARWDGLRLAVGLLRYWFQRDTLLPGGRSALFGLLGRLDAGEGVPAPDRKCQRLLADGWRAAGEAARARGKDYGAALSALGRAEDLYASLGEDNEATVARGLAGAVRAHMGDYVTARTMIEPLLPLLGRETRREGFPLLDALAFAYREQGEYEKARRCLEQCTALCRRLGDATGEAHCRFSLGYVAQGEGDAATAEGHFGAAMGAFRRAGDRAGEARCLCALGGLARDRGDFAGAESLIRRALALNHGTGNRAGEAWNLSELGEIRLREGDPAGAQIAFMEAYRINRDLGARNTLAQNLAGLARAAFARRDLSVSLEWYREGIRLMRDLGMRMAVLRALEFGADLWATLGESEGAVLRLCALRALWGEAGVSKPLDGQQEWERKLDSLRVTLGDERYHLLCEKGRGMTLDEIVELDHQGWAKSV